VTNEKVLSYGIENAAFTFNIPVPLMTDPAFIVGAKLIFHVPLFIIDPFNVIFVFNEHVLFIVNDPLTIRVPVPTILALCDTLPDIVTLCGEFIVTTSLLLGMIPPTHVDADVQSPDDNAVT
jgi:hypothetical protein